MVLDVLSACMYRYHVHQCLRKPERPSDPLELQLPRESWELTPGPLQPVPLNVESSLQSVYISTYLSFINRSIIYLSIETRSLYSFGQPGTSYIDQTSLELIEICLFLPLEGCELKVYTITSSDTYILTF